MHSKTILGAVLAASLLGAGAAAHAQLVVSIAPPAPQYEVVPAPRTGYVWAAGHHEWRNNRYVWVPGRWLTARDGYEYRDQRWVQRGNGQWTLAGGNWERRGPNRYDNNNDRNRMGPYGDLDRDGIRNQDDRDRDGDGIRNNRDRYPDDRRRS